MAFKEGRSQSSHSPKSAVGLFPLEAELLRACPYVTHRFYWECREDRVLHDRL